jgi:hypothetical protein
MCWGLVKVLWVLCESDSQLFVFLHVYFGFLFTIMGQSCEWGRHMWCGKRSTPANLPGSSGRMCNCLNLKLAVVCLSFVKLVVLSLLQGQLHVADLIPFQCMSFNRTFYSHHTSLFSTPLHVCMPPTLPDLTSLICYFSANP